MGRKRPCANWCTLLGIQQVAQLTLQWMNALRMHNGAAYISNYRGGADAKLFLPLSCGDVQWGSSVQGQMDRRPCGSSLAAGVTWLSYFWTLYVFSIEVSANTGLGLSAIVATNNSSLASSRWCKGLSFHSAVNCRLRPLHVKYMSLFSKGEVSRNVRVSLCSFQRQTNIRAGVFTRLSQKCPLPCAL